MNERELAGGNISAVSTDGSIIYKNRKPQSETAQRLLKHVWDKGIDFCPKPLGFDDKGREMLSFMPGDTIDDYPPVSSLEHQIAAVKQIAGMLRAFHDATADFIQKPEDVWFLRYDGDLPREVICHNDIAPYNTTFINNLPTGFIDFDTLCPAPREWDIAYALYRFVPLSKTVYDVDVKRYRDYDRAKDGEERTILLREFLRAYGYDRFFDIKKYVVQRLEALVQLFDEECGKGNEAFLKMQEEGHRAFYCEEIGFIKRESVYFL